MSESSSRDRVKVSSGIKRLTAHISGAVYAWVVEGFHLVEREVITFHNIKPNEVTFSQSVSLFFLFLEGTSYYLCTQVDSNNVAKIPELIDLSTQSS